MSELGNTRGMEGGWACLVESRLIGVRADEEPTRAAL